MAADLAFLCSSEERARSIAHLQEYYQDDRGRPAYSGSRFDFFGENPTHRIVLDDLLAVSMLSVAVPAHAALRILERDAGAITALLMQIPADCDLHDADPHLIDHQSPAEQLWKVLRDGARDGQRLGMGEVRVSKLLARKRPRLLPVYDRYVGEALELKNSDEHWLCLHGLLQTQPDLSDCLRDLGRVAGAPSEVSVLRLLDVLLWMRGRSDEDAHRQRGSD